jgi:glutamyl-tRNA synthetase
VETFDLGKLSRSPGRFDVTELKALNAKLLHHLPYDAVADRLEAAGVPGGKEFWEAVRGNLQVFADVRKWWGVVSGPVMPLVEDAALASRAADLLPAEPWDASTWSIWTDAVKTATGTKGRALFHPLRLALTGEEAGPELKALLPLIGRARAFERLNGRPG